MLHGSKKALKLLSFKAFFVVRGTGLEPMTPRQAGGSREKLLLLQQNCIMQFFDSSVHFIQIGV